MGPRILIVLTLCYIFTLAPAEELESASMDAGCADDNVTMIAKALEYLSLTISSCSDMSSSCEDATYGAIVKTLCPVTCGSCQAACDYQYLCTTIELPTHKQGVKCAGATCNISSDRAQCCGPPEVECPPLNVTECRGQDRCWWKDDVSCISMPCFDNDQQAQRIATKNSMSDVTDCNSWCSSATYKSYVAPGSCDSSCHTCPPNAEIKTCQDVGTDCDQNTFCCSNICDENSKCCGVTGFPCSSPEHCCGTLTCSHGKCEAATAFPTDPDAANHATCAAWNYGIPNQHNLHTARWNMIDGGAAIADPHKYPWQVYLEYPASVSNPTPSASGGTIIGREWILTAAHVVGTWSENGTTFTVNDLNSFKVVAGLHATASYDVAAIHIHPDYLVAYNKKPQMFDIALVQLTNSLSCADSNIRPISLLQRTFPQQKNVIDGCIAWITGFGMLNDKTKLQEAQMQVYDTDHCRRWPNGEQIKWPNTTVYGDAFDWRGFQAYEKVSQKKISESQICAIPEGNVCMGQGDAGGPLIIDIDTSAQNEYVQVGIISRGVGACPTDVPALYTDVSYPPIKDWITSKYSGAKWTAWSTCDKQRTPSPTECTKGGHNGTFARSERRVPTTVIFGDYNFQTHEKCETVLQMCRNNGNCNSNSSETQYILGECCISAENKTISDTFYDPQGSIAALQACKRGSIAALNRKDDTIAALQADKRGSIAALQARLRACQTERDAVVVERDEKTATIVQLNKETMSLKAELQRLRTESATNAPPAYENQASSSMPMTYDFPVLAFTFFAGVMIMYFVR